MSQSALAQIAALEHLSMADLQARWRELIGTEPPRYNREFLIRRLAYRMQELVYGGLRQAARAGMVQLLAQAGCDELGSLRPSKQTGRGRRESPVAGTRLIREWNGQPHEVTAVPGGFAYRGRRYRSLTAIAELITGTHWNGPSFFGLRSNGRKEGAR
jgi:hypothetical protein